MKIQIVTGSYNARRYSKPWIARVDFTDPKGTFSFGEWTGQHYGGTGSEGILHIEAEPGDIVCHGQKDYRVHNGQPEFDQILSDGTVKPLGSKVDAFRAFTDEQNRRKSATTELPQNPLAGFSNDQLISELKTRGITTL